MGLTYGFDVSGYSLYEVTHRQCQLRKKAARIGCSVHKDAQSAKQGSLQERVVYAFVA